MHDTPLIGPYNPDDVLAWGREGLALPNSFLPTCLPWSRCLIGPRCSISRPAATSFWLDLPPRFCGVN